MQDYIEELLETTSTLDDFLDQDEYLDECLDC